MTTTATTTKAAKNRARTARRTTFASVPSDEVAVLESNVLLAMAQRSPSANIDSLARRYLISIGCDDLRVFVDTSAAFEDAETLRRSVRRSVLSRRQAARAARIAAQSQMATWRRAVEIGDAARARLSEAGAIGPTGSGARRDLLDTLKTGRRTAA